MQIRPYHGRLRAIAVKAKNVAAVTTTRNRTGVERKFTEVLLSRQRFLPSKLTRR
jgi:hypothetical protein